MIEPMTLTEPREAVKKRKQSLTLSPSDVETVSHFQRMWKFESFSAALRRIIREYAELMDEREAAA